MAHLAHSVAGMAAALGGLGVIILLVLHLLPGSGGVDPINHLLSEYPLRSYEVGVPYVLALLSANTAAVLVGRLMARSGLLRGRLTKGLFAVSCVSLLGLTVFLKDPIGTHATLFGTVHGVCTVLTCVSQLVLACVLWWRYRANQVWRWYARAVGVLAVLASMTLVPFVVAFTTRGGADRFAGMAIGLVERSMFVVLIAMTVVLALWAQAMTRNGAPRTVPRRPVVAC